MTNHVARLWVQKPKPAAKLRLLCISYAGSGASTFRDWNFGDDIEVAAVQLPGREWRRNEPLATSMAALVDDLFEDIVDWISGPQKTAFFGYSMGAVLSYSLINRLQQTGHKLPDALFAAASLAPQVMGKKTPIYTLSDEDFMVEIGRLGGMPDAIMNEPALLQLAIPVLRADFQALYTYNEPQFATLDCPIMVYGGSEDPHAPRNSLANWRSLTSANFNIRLFSGSHFFINSSKTQLLKTLEVDLNTLLT